MSELAADFQDLQSLLEAAGSLVEASECHGILSGFACAGRPFDAREVIPHLLAGEIEPEHEEHLDLDLQRAMRDIQLELEDDTQGFRLLLPDDDEPLLERADALGKWCQGFLFGAGLGGIRSSEGQSSDFAEVLSDLAEIAQAGDYEIDGEDEDEFAYMELVEHVRIGVMLIYEELRGVEVSAEPPQLH